MHISNALASGDKSTTSPLSNSQRIDAMIRHHSRQPLICSSDDRSRSLVQEADDRGPSQRAPATHHGAASEADFSLLASPLPRSLPA